MRRSSICQGITYRLLNLHGFTSRPGGQERLLAELASRMTYCFLVERSEKGSNTSPCSSTETMTDPEQVCGPHRLRLQRTQEGEYFQDHAHSPDALHLSGEDEPFFQ